MITPNSSVRNLRNLDLGREWGSGDHDGCPTDWGKPRVVSVPESSQKGSEYRSDHWHCHHHQPSSWAKVQGPEPHARHTEAMSLEVVPVNLHLACLLVKNYNLILLSRRNCLGRGWGHCQGSKYVSVVPCG